MIIVEDSESKPLLIVPQDEAAGQLTGHFGSVHPQSPPVQGAPSSFTPSYHTTPLLPPPPPPPSYPKHPYQHPAYAAPAVPQHRPSQSPVKRFWKAFAFALVVYLALLTLTQTIIQMASSGIVSAIVGGMTVRRALLTIVTLTAPGRRVCRRS